MVKNNKPNKPLKSSKHAHRVITRLNQEEYVQFLVIRKYVVGYCGKVSDAEVLRYLVRHWSES